MQMQEVFCLASHPPRLQPPQHHKRILGLVVLVEGHAQQAVQHEQLQPDETVLSVLGGLGISTSLHVSKLWVGLPLRRHLQDQKEQHSASLQWAGCFSSQAEGAHQKTPSDMPPMPSPLSCTFLGH